MNPLLNVNDCPVCLEPIQDGEKAIHITETVSHVFHRECLDAWFLEQSRNGRQNKCPSCNVTVVDHPRIQGPDAIYDTVEPNEIEENFQAPFVHEVPQQDYKEITKLALYYVFVLPPMTVVLGGFSLLQKGYQEISDRICRRG
jgi:hypothetical protein